MRKIGQQQGFSLMILIFLLIGLSGIGLTGWYVWKKKEDKTGKPNVSQDDRQISGTKKGDQSRATNGTENWATVTSQAGAFSMKVPDGWKITNYPQDYIGGTEVTYSPGQPGRVSNERNAYTGHALRFRASVVPINDAGLGPEWSSPQSDLREAAEDFSIGSLQGKRYKGVFSHDLDQTIYEYVFALQGNKKLDIVYLVDHALGHQDDVGTVEKAIKTIKFKTE